MRKQQGFTLVELMVVLGVAAILTTVALPGMQNLVLDNRRVAAVNELVASMQLARSESITRNARVTTCPSTDGVDCAATTWDSGWLVFVDDDADRRVDAGETVLRTVSAHDGMQIASAEFDSFFVYRPNGRIMVNDTSENNGQFTVCDRRGATAARVLIVDMSGRPRASAHQTDGNAPVCVG